MKKQTAIILIICMLITFLSSVCFAAPMIGQGAQGGDMGEGYPSYGTPTYPPVPDEYLKEHPGTKPEEYWSIPGKKPQSTISMTLFSVKDGVNFLVTDAETGAPLPDVLIYNIPILAPVVPAGRTDKDGKAFIALPALESGETFHDYVYDVRKIGYHDSGNVTLRYTGGIVNFPVTLAPIKYNVPFVVRAADDHNYLIEGAAITVKNKDGNVVASTVTDASGQAAVTLLYGEYTYTVQKNEYIVWTSALDATAQPLQQTIDLTLESMAANVGFTVTNDNHEVVSNAKIEVSKDGAQLALAYTDAKGYASLVLPKNAQYKCLFTHKVHDDLNLTLNIGRNTDVKEAVIMQRKLYDLQLYVEDTNKVPVADAVITIGGQAVRTDAIGSATLKGLYAGNYAYRITKAGYANSTGVLRVPEDGGITLVLNE
ncbi:MAG: carboxypeptidase-like regulatory domain-containing protein, partial [Christensenella sp.]